MAMVQYAAARIVGITALVYHHRDEPDEEETVKWTQVIEGKGAVAIWKNGEIIIGHLLEKMGKKVEDAGWTWRTGR